MPYGTSHNPYAPGAGLQPPELAGRDRLIEDAAIDMDRLLDRRPTKGIVLLGLRGVGKTVLLNRLHHMVDEKGIHTAKIEAPEGGTLPQLLGIICRRLILSNLGDSPLSWFNYDCAPRFNMIEHEWRDSLRERSRRARYTCALSRLSTRPYL